MEAGDLVIKRCLLCAVCAAAMVGSLLGPAQAFAGGTLTPSTSNLPFGSVSVGSSSMMSKTLTNTAAFGTTTITNDTITGTNASEFSSDHGCDNMALSSFQNCTVTVTFSPNSPGMKTATLHVPNDSSNPDVTVTLTGTGTGTSLAVSPPAFDFGTLLPGTQSAAQTFTATSDGTNPVTVSQVSIAGANPDQFQRTGGTCVAPPFMLNPTESCTVDVAFAPTSSGAKTASLEFTSNALGSPDASTLTGSGIAPGQPTQPPALLQPVSTPTENPACAALRAKLMKAKTKAKKRKIRRQLRNLGC